MSRLIQERAFTATLLRLSRIWRREVDRVLAVHGTSEARALPILQIARLGEGVRQGPLADSLGIEGPSLVRLLDQLCAAGLVERRDDPRDGRAKTLHLTPEGRALAAVIEETIDGVRAIVLAKITNEDLAAALGAFGAFEASLEEFANTPRAPGG